MLSLSCVILYDVPLLCSIEPLKAIVCSGAANSEFLSERWYLRFSESATWLLTRAFYQMKSKGAKDVQLCIFYALVVG